MAARKSASVAFTVKATLLAHKPGAALATRFDGQVICGGWFVSGDMGLIDDRGRLYLKGRERDEINKVPLLGDLPAVGWLFKNTVRTSNKTELLIFLTPKIVTDRSAAR